MDHLMKDYQFFLDNRESLVKDYDGLYILISNEKVVDAFSDENDAYYYGIEKFGLGNFIVQLCVMNEEAYTQTFQSRVVFV